MISAADTVSPQGPGSSSCSGFYAARAAWIAAACVLATSAPQHVSASENNESAPALLLDADSANEIDDLYAIARVLQQDQYRVVALNSTQWQHREAAPGDFTVRASQECNETMLLLCGRQEILAPMGSANPVGRPWGGREPRPSAAASAIVEHALRASPADKLHVVCLGASTNVASAVSLAPEIVDRLRVSLLGFRFDTDREVWNKSSFNVRRDLNAADQLLDTEGLELHIMPANVAGELRFDRGATFERLSPLGDLGEYLGGQWRKRFGDHGTWIMWDVALVEALLDPTLAVKKPTETPPENVRRTVHVYRSIDSEAMLQRFWDAMAAYRVSGASPR